MIFIDEQKEFTVGEWNYIIERIIKKMDPLTLNLLVTFGLKLSEQFKHRNDVLSEEEITTMAQSHLEEALSANKQLQDETKGV